MQREASASKKGRGCYGEGVGRASDRQGWRECRKCRSNFRCARKRGCAQLTRGFRARPRLGRAGPRCGFRARGLRLLGLLLRVATLRRVDGFAGLFLGRRVRRLVARGLRRVGTGVLDEIALRLALVLEVRLVPAAALQAELRRRDEPLQLRLAALRALAQRRFHHFLQSSEVVPASTAAILVDRHTARLCSSSGFFLDALHESERVTLADDADDLAGAEIAAQDTLRERILQLLLNRSLQ